MTREEAKALLLKARPILATEELKTAIDTAIKALSEPTGDLISRADAIGAVHEYYQKRFTEDSKWDADAKMLVLEDKTIAKDNMEICNIIKELPSTDAEYADLPDIPRAYYESIVGKMAHEINMLKEQLESADAAQGEWIKRGTKIKCSNCKSAWSTSFDTIIVGMKYCPMCGARMEASK